MEAGEGDKKDDDTESAVRIEGGKEESETESEQAAEDCGINAAQPSEASEKESLEKKPAEDAKKISEPAQIAGQEGPPTQQKD